MVFLSHPCPRQQPLLHLRKRGEQRVHPHLVGFPSSPELLSRLHQPSLGFLAPDLHWNSKLATHTWNSSKNTWIAVCHSLTPSGRRRSKLSCPSLRFKVKKTCFQQFGEDLGILGDKPGKNYGEIAAPVHQLHTPN